MLFRLCRRNVSLFVKLCLIAGLVTFPIASYRYYRTKVKHLGSTGRVLDSKPITRLYPNKVKEYKTLPSRFEALLDRSSQYLPPRPLLSSEERLSHLQRRCLLHGKRSWSSLSFDEKQVTSRQAIVDDGRQIVYFYVPKVACSNWKRVFSVLAGKARTAGSIKKVDHKKFTFLRDYPPFGIEQRIRTYYKFVFVREPLERLVSAYRDKFLGYKKSFLERFSSKIIKKYRKKSKHRKKNIDDKIPTLTEFLKFIVSIKPLKMNEHWMPYKEISQPCAVKYDFIGSFDTLAQDADRVLHQLQIREIVQFPTRQPYYYQSISNQTTFDQLISQVPKSVLRAVVKKYIEDYDLFSFPLPQF